MKKKLLLKDIKLTSFITSFTNFEKGTIVGGKYPDDGTGFGAACGDGGAPKTGQKDCPHSDT